MISKGFLLFAMWMVFWLSAVAHADDLTCSISVPSLKPKADGTLPAELILKNNGPTAIRVCTLCMGWRSTSKGKFEVMLTPDSWKSDAPTREMSAQSIKTIEPGETCRIPFAIFTDKESQLHVKASYAVGKEFAEALHTWSGYIEAEPVELQLERP